MLPTEVINCLLKCLLPALLAVVPDLLRLGIMWKKQNCKVEKT
jgi:hypothetical protein